MEWTESLRSAIDYMEKNLLEDIRAEDVAEQVHISSFYLQKVFRIMTGYSIGEYIRFRRLYLAALEVVQDDEKIIDIAYKYGYETPESFTKAFSRFHGVSPARIKKKPDHIKMFLPLKIRIEVKGGNDMDVVVEKMNSFKVIGFDKVFETETAQEEIPKYWTKFQKQYIMPLLWMGKKPKTAIEETILRCRIAEFGICIDDMEEKGKFRYMIAGRYDGGEVPEGMKVYEFQDMEWAKFRCVGPMPGALHALNNQIFKEWLPGNPDYEVAQYVNIEWYTKGDMSAANYESGVWIPVKRKK